MDHRRQIRGIDGAAFSTLEEFYDHVGEVLIPGAQWGKNLDALRDVLSGGFGLPEHGFVLIWLRSDLSRRRLGYAETVRQLELRLERCHPTWRQSVRDALHCAQRRTGPTIFDWLVEIMTDDPSIELRLE